MDEKTEAQQKWQDESQSSTQHAQWVAGRVMTLLSHYFQPDNPVEVQEAAIGDWLVVIGKYSSDEINEACQSYLRDQPRRRPAPGDIRARIMGVQKARIETVRPMLAPPPELPREPRVTPEAATQILAEAGIEPSLSQLLKRFPMAKTAEEAEALAEEPPEKRMTYETNPERLAAARKAARPL